jgi:gliding motility-associated-like protein
MLSASFSFSQCSFSLYPPGEVCTSANYICGSELNGFTGRLPDSLSVSQLWNGCNGNGVADNIVWFSFTPTQSRVTLCITPSNCTTSSGGFSGVQAGIYSQCRASAALDCTDKVGDFNGKTSRFCLTSDFFIPCEPGYLFIDGYAKSVCDFHIEVIEGIDLVNVNTPDLSTLDPGFISGPDTISCADKNVPIRYSITPPECLFVSNPACGMPVNLPDDSICFEWKILPSTGAFFTSGKKTGQFIDIVFTEAGIYTITAETFLHPFYGGSCGSGGCGSIFEWQVNVKEPDTLVLQPIFICPGDAVSVCGTLVTTDSTLTCFSGTDNCTVLVQQIIAGTNKLNDLGIQYVCRGDVFSFQGVDFNIDGNYEVLDNSDCTLLHRFSIENLDISTSLNAGISTLDCIQQVIELNGNVSSNYPGDVSLQWKNNSGNIFSNGINVSISQPGSYVFSASITKGNATCTSESSVSINQDIEYPQIEIFKPRFNCFRPKGIITVNSARTLLNPVWRLPLGNIINDQSFFADSLNVLTGGIYQFSAVGSNGCSIDTTISLEIDFSKPTLELSGEDLTCYKPATTLSFSCDMVYDSVRWIYNGFFQTSIGITYNTSLPGNYMVEVRAASSKCWNDDAKLINEDKIRPQVEVGPDLLWHCNTKSLDVNPVLSTGAPFEYFWQTNNGVIRSDRSSSGITVGSTGTYVLEVLNKNNGCTSNDVFSVNKETNIPEDIIALVSDPFCYGESNGQVNIENIIGGFAPYRYYINQAPLTGTRINGLPSGIYRIAAKDNYDCEVSLEVRLSDPPLLEVDLPLEINLAFQENFKMVFETNYPISDIVNVTWKNEKGEIIGNQLQLDYNANINEIISVEIETINGCKAETRAKIIVDTELKLLIPNIFSPNGDDVNDILFIGKNKIPAEIDQISVYDRFGNMVYQSKDIIFNEASTGWDGTYGGRKVVPGIYVMILHITDFQGNKKIIRQDLTIIH